MLGWLNKQKDLKRWHDDDVQCARLTGTLPDLYKEKLLPLEDDFMYSRTHAPPIADGDFTAKPMILILGQYSTGKSTFIKHLLQREYPGMRIGPEPTTDKFVCVMGGPSDQVVPGNAVVVDRKLPFSQLPNQEGASFYDHFEASICSSAVLNGVTLLDTPGILSGEKQRANRGYDYERITGWFADRVDMIILLFDAHSLDISDEFHRVINTLKGNTRKVRLVLNKADSVDSHELLRVYGALMWSLGKVMGTPEASRIYIGSFWNEKLKCDDLKAIFDKDAGELYKEISMLPKNGALRQVNDLIKRARMVRVNACVMSYLRSQINGACCGGKVKQKQLMAKLPDVFSIVADKYKLPIGDFPDPEVYRSILNEPAFDFGNVIKISEAKLKLRLGSVSELLQKDIPHVISLLPVEMASELSAAVPQLVDGFGEREGAE